MQAIAMQVFNTNHDQINYIDSPSVKTECYICQYYTIYCTQGAVLNIEKNRPRLHTPCVSCIYGRWHCHSERKITLVLSKSLWSQEGGNIEVMKYKLVLMIIAFSLKSCIKCAIAIQVANRHQDLIKDIVNPPIKSGQTFADSLVDAMFKKCFGKYGCYKLLYPFWNSHRQACF